jgi:hypothetical protein
VENPAVGLYVLAGKRAEYSMTAPVLRQRAMVNANASGLVGNLASPKKVLHAPIVVEHQLFVRDGSLATSLESIGYRHRPL